MRIIAGEFRSRRLLTPKDASVTRPIPDRVKESLFGLLRGHCEGASVFDGFAGTGAIGLEAISRGAARCVFIERDKGAADLLRRNIEALGVQDRCDIVVGDALGPGALSRAPRPATLVFLDPPYPIVRDQVGWKRVRAQFQRLIDLLTDDGFAILRTPWPFFLEISASPGPGAGAPTGHDETRHREGPRKGRDRSEHHRDRRERRGGPEVIYDIERAKAESEIEPQAQAVPKAEIERAEADLTFPNAQGPETHVYHSTALHLYMKKRPNSPDASIAAQGGPSRA